eukprot:CAMPEP_0178383642 /NCGR_PEP_ID=MMETSP0689_2-20121128/7105_1 /TAXON_ID=160604 /ORGANISM="Amphidinium massartii, Strain CS-259" /LENGTH=1704 /DNA_ID=CAMNT_0020003865 /DNA_START=14 /DNA_END=5129 /DNA_ORIENTATION=+
MFTSVMAPTLLSMIFATCFVCLTSLLPIRMAGEINDAVATRFATTPWRLNPTSTLQNISNGAELYEWLDKVFISQLFAGYPVNGDPDGYCTDQYPCQLYEGDGDRSTGCAEGLVLGDDNCPSWMIKMDCCEPCSGDDCGNFTWYFDTGSVATTMSVDAFVVGLIDLEDQYQGVSSSEEATVFDTSYKFCPERAGRMSQMDFSSTGDRRPVTVAEYNRAVMGRVTLKRLKLERLNSDRFANAYPVKTTVPMLSAYSDSDGEDKVSFGTEHTYQYSSSGGFRDTGGYIQYFDFSLSEAVSRNELYTLQKNNWFDMKLGSFVWEVLFYNGNANLFMHVSFVFEQKFTGMVIAHMDVAPLDLTLHEVSSWETWFRYILFVVVLALLVYFVKNEIDDMTSEGSEYFKNLVNLVHLTSLGLSLYLIILHFQITLNYRYVQFKFPLESNVGGEEEVFRDLVGLANDQATYNTIISITTCLIFSRCISLISTLAPDSGVIFNTFSQAKENLMSAFVLFLVVFAGFTFCSWFLLCTAGTNFYNLPSTITSHMTMIMGFSNYDAIRKGDPNIALPYFCVFHLFWLVVKQLLLSIIICGYLKERETIAKPGQSDKYPLRRFLQSAMQTVREWLSPLLKGAVTISNLLFGGGGRGGTVRVNYEQVGRLKDKRVTKPRMRNVEYERKGGKDDSAEKLSIMPRQDITLEAKMPYYRDGHMHFYVTDRGDGPAKENGVRIGERLVKITKHDQADVHFREKAKFTESQAKRGYGGNPANILPNDLKDLPVTLEFEGYVKPVSFECVGLLIFVVAYCTFILNVVRTDAVYHLREITERHLLQECWKEYHPERVVCFDDITDASDIHHWITRPILQMEYGCTSSIGNPDCAEFDPATYRRDGWTRWTGPFMSRRNRPDVYPTLGYTPPALDGYSMGYVSWREAWEQDPSLLEKVEVVPRAGVTNVGVMPQNHMRLTIQITCFTRNEFVRTERGIPWVVVDEIRGRRCATEECLQDQIDLGLACYDYEGTRIDPANITGPYTRINYVNSQRSSHGKRGGYAIGLGNTRAEAATIMNDVVKDQMIAPGTASAVLEWVNYNGELDLFKYTQVLFSIADSGKMFKEVRTTTFALNLFSVGPGQETARYLNVALCITYFACALGFTIYLIQDLFYVQYQITTQLQRPRYMCLIDFFREDWWNFVDVLSVCLNIGVIYYLLSFMLYNGSMNSSWHINSWVLTNYQFRPWVTERDRDEFSEFFDAAQTYDNFVELASVNGMFLLVRCIKYFGAIPQLRLIMTTLSAGVYEFLNLIIILLILLFSFVLLFYVQYGAEIMRISTFHGAFVQLFLYMVGDFNIWDLFENDPVYFSILFIIYTVLFGFLLTNVFLAAIVWRWKEVRKDAQNKNIFELIWENAWDICSCCKRKSKRQKGESSQKEVVLDKDFWGSLSALQYLEFLDEKGSLSAAATDDRKDKPGGKSEGDGMQVNGTDPEKGRLMDLSKEGQERLEMTFQRAHMELASIMCRAVPDHAKDTGAGVKSVLNEDSESEEDEEADEGGHEELQTFFEVGILDQPMEQAQAGKIKQRVMSLLAKDEKKDQHCDEIWLDCLITVLEEARALERLQTFFRPPPMHKPKKPEDWGKYNARKVKMQHRLELFLRFCKERMREEHYKYLKERAAAKDRVLKQQSIYLAEYLSDLNEHIDTLKAQITKLDEQNAKMRQHVTPLL